MLLEDIWPSHWLTVKQADSARERIQAQCAQAGWARAYWVQLIEEADTVLAQSPQVPMEPAGWRHDFYSPDSAAHLQYNPESPHAHLDPSTGLFYDTAAMHSAWVMLTHERTFKVMRSVGLLYAGTQDERYAAWVTEGMRRACDYVELAENNGWERGAFGGAAVWYQPLYDSTMLLALANAYALTRHSGAYSETDHERIRTAIFESRIPKQIGFLQNIGGLQNMAAYAAAAVAVAGELFERDDWLSIGIGKEFGFVRWLEANVPDGPDGNPDGLWEEQTTFYHYYALAPLITLYHLADNLSGDNQARFRAMFVAPLELVQPDLNFHLMGDLGVPGEWSLVDVRSFYEFAAGELDYDRFAPILAYIYEQSHLVRGCLWSLFYGPACLPDAGFLPRGHHVLSVSGYGVFRDPVGGMTMGFRGGRFRGGHDHPDRLSVTFYKGKTPVAVDLGEPGYGLRVKTDDYFRRTISHNTVFSNESDNRGNAVIDWDFASVPARARGIIANDGGVNYVRTIYFDPPFAVVVDSYQAFEETRFGWAFHANGELALIGADVDVATVANPPYDMSPLPTNRLGYAMLTARRAATIQDCLMARWTVNEDVLLDAHIISDGGLEATVARSAGNPFPADRGALILRARGTERKIYTVFELHEGAPQVSNVSRDDEAGLRVLLVNGSERRYAWDCIVQA